jgi:hypothetical protein
MTVYGRTRCYTIVYGSRIAPYMEQRSSVFNHSVFLHDLRIRNPFHIVYGVRVRPPYISVFLRKRSFTTVPIRPGYIDKKTYFILRAKDIDLIWYYYGCMRLMKYYLVLWSRSSISYYLKKVPDNWKMTFP